MFGKREFVFRDYFIKKIKVLLLSARTEWHQDLAGVTLTVAKTIHEFLAKFYLTERVTVMSPFPPNSSNTS